MKYAKDYLAEFLGGHRIITWASMQALPDWQREIWQEHQYDLAERYSLYGDMYYNHKEEVGPYMEYPDGSVPPMGTIGVLRLHVCYGHATDFWESPFWDEQAKEFTYFLDRIATCIKAGDMLGAAKWSGSIAHHITDAGVPAHTMDNGDLEYLKDLLEIPEKFVCFPLHGYTEQSPPRFLINDYRPRLYGRTAAEAGVNYCDRIVQLTLASRKLMLPMAQAAFREDHAAAEQLRFKAAKECAYAFADFMYTATCLGANRFEPADLEALRVKKLTDAWPFRSSQWAPPPYLESGPLKLRGINLDKDRKPVPCELLVSEGGKVVSRQYKEALGAGAYYEYHWRLPAGSYQRLTALVGVHAVLGAMRSIKVEVKSNGKSVWSDVIKPGEPAKPIDVAIDGATDVQFISSGPWYTQPDGCNNHVVWAEPRVCF